MDADTLSVVLERIADLKEQAEQHRHDSIREHQETRRAVGVLAEKVQKQNGSIGKAHRRVDELEDREHLRRQVNDRRWRVVKYFGAGTFSVATVVVGVVTQHLIG